MDSKNIKQATAQYELLPEIKNRWSARAFDGSPLSVTELNTLLEAAAWAPSANNEQPWIYYYAHRNTEAFKSLWDCLVEGNRPWTAQAAVLMIACTRTTFEQTGKHNGSAEHDLGLANANLLTQATGMNIYGHIMGGFDRAKATALLQLPDNIRPMYMIALGKLGDPASLEEPYKSRELAPRSRKPLDEIVIAI
ncbi:MAG: nitroreductase family protein [Saprospiraceae bacterium]|nr:nitroreductase family protein [Saprospiraceae bacterium]HMW40194.1 nitroreductase family protein [Saprospiraceae bacterium]HMX87060.1 nitroreductase family protein [Saprospiraceae bacterium]HMZ41371.1 nitroreductase family protein [Saprospiraceae bacterium]HNB31465.1 nitroreductase family protein [Saprospiraceae bacterium]